MFRNYCFSSWQELDKNNILSIPKDSRLDFSSWLLSLGTLDGSILSSIFFLLVHDAVNYFCPLLICQLSGSYFWISKRFHNILSIVNTEIWCQLINGYEPISSELNRLLFPCWQGWHKLVGIHHEAPDWEASISQFFLIFWILISHSDGGPSPHIAGV